MDDGQSTTRIETSPFLSFVTYSVLTTGVPREPDLPLYSFIR